MIDLLVAGANVPPVHGGIERFVDGLARHVSPSTAVRRLPPSGPRALASMATAPRARVVLAAEWWPAARALSSLPRRGTRAVLLHGSEVRRSLGRPDARRSLRRSLAACDVLLANSTYTAGLVADAGAAASVLHPGVDLDRPADDPASVARRYDVAGRPVVLTAARLVRRKGHVGLLQAWDVVRRRHPDAIWLIAGDGPERAAVESAAGEGVRVLGAVDDRALAGLLRLADLHVLPGIEVDGEVEGFGMAAVEAGAAGTPTVGTDVGGTAEAVGCGGVVVPPDPEAVACAVADLLDEPTQLAALGRAARRRAEALAWPLVAARFREEVGL